MAYMMSPASTELILPSLFGDGANEYRVRPSNFLYSLLLHGAVIAAVLYLATVTVRVVNNPKASLSTLLAPVSLPPAFERAGGGGGGGARELLPVNRGTPPKTSMEQIAPPTVHVMENPKLAAPSAVIVPQTLVASNAIGDLKGVLGPASDGAGHGSGIGNGNGGGVGRGNGRGVGPGSTAGTGDKIYHPGGGISQPTVVRQVEPEFSDEARRAKYQGTVLVSIVIGADGLVHDARLASPLGMGLDEKALEAARQWKFLPGKKDGRPVAVYAQIEVSFHLY
ncbi:MAG: TonB family protein [Acidobacteriaceae bacterium]